MIEEDEDEKSDQLIMGNPSQSYRTSPAIWDHTLHPYLPPDTSKRAPSLTPASKLLLDLPTPEGRKAELT